MKFKSRTALLFMAFTVMVGCGQKKTMYHWGAYQGVIHDMYVSPGTMTAATQVIKLNEDISQAAANGQKVPPGLYAHLSMAYAAEGQTEKSTAALLKEQELFPESKTLIKTLMSNVNRNGGQQ